MAGERLLIKSHYSSFSIHGKKCGKGFMRFDLNFCPIVLILTSSSNMINEIPIVRVSEKAWRAATSIHVGKIRELLLPGLISEEHVLNSGKQRRGSKPDESGLTALDPMNPVFNFLIEYYGLKGSKATRRLARWSPTPQLLVQKENRITELEQLTSPLEKEDKLIFEGVLLEGATENDLGATLHLRGAMPYDGGILYSPRSFFSSDLEIEKSATAYMWYRSVLQQTVTADPVLHCHGMHEWAMQYWPEGASPPPSAKYQKHLPLRVSRGVINDAVERKGISCTHVDALRYFAPAAGPLNHHGHSLKREQQLELEQPACVHAQMDLLKMALKLVPFCDPILLQNSLEIALDARKLDIAASPYDVTAFGVGVIPVETSPGRKEYRRQQVNLMKKAQPIRLEMLSAYNLLLEIGFGEKVNFQPAPERFARAEPGGLPWRQNLIK
jgi:hypothetical protein